MTKEEGEIKNNNVEANTNKEEDEKENTNKEANKEDPTSKIVIEDNISSNINEIKEKAYKEDVENQEQKIEVPKISNDILKEIDVTISAPPKRIINRLKNVKITIYVTNFGKSKIRKIPLVIENNNKGNLEKVTSINPGEQKKITFVLSKEELQNDNSIKVHFGKKMKKLTLG